MNSPSQLLGKNTKINLSDSQKQFYKKIVNETISTEVILIKIDGAQSPLNQDPPTKVEVSQSKTLVKYLIVQNLFESEEESARRESILGSLNKIIHQWSLQVCTEAGIPENEQRDSGAKIYTFGSYRLGVHGPGTDIDTLCVVPKHFDAKKDFFEKLCRILQSHPEVEELQPVPEATVPIIKMVFCKIQFDLLFAQLRCSTIEDNINLSDEALKDISKESLLSLNGCRVTDTILQLVPNKINFRTTLRSIKFWAKRRGVYANALGYPGGVSWALLTAFICQLYPTAVPSKLILKFFTVYKMWPWSKPVQICKSENPNTYEDWQKSYKMAVITPVQPTFNSTRSILSSTLEILKEEFKRGYRICQKIDKNTAEWDLLFEKSKFLQLYKYYIRVEIFADNENDFRSWSGFAEAKLYIFCRTLETLTMTTDLEKIHLYPVNFPSDKTNFATCFYIAFTLKPRNTSQQSKRMIDLSTAVAKYHEKLAPQKKPTVGVACSFLKRFYNSIDFINLIHLDLNFQIQYLKVVNDYQGLYKEEILIL
eukprot:TRINITY_DN783_c0_g1_i4.p1 TRINITY_DN783_c0_g1~~TRINITY_DN783_c0_g1_i4.p1  ORF type:complete len:538 (-),score=186.82 TRINITY_DN783_c0_g1_i4:455-2068(-)